MEKKIKISEDIICYIEKLDYEYHQSLFILKYLFSCESVKKDRLDEYFNDTKILGEKLEIAKREISRKAFEENNIDSRFVECYCFDFVNNLLKVKVI